MKKQRLSVMAIIALVIPSVVGAYFTTAPRYMFRHADESALVLTFKHTSRRTHECGSREKDAFVAGIRNLKHSQNAGIQCGSRERNPVGLRIMIDGKDMARKEIQPRGWKHDAAVFVFERFYLPPGAHHVAAFMRDSDARGDTYDYRYEGDIRIERGMLAVMDFNDGKFTVHQ